ncbi:TM2 domain-containing protein [Hyalangium rubrum]|uniref:TM2 domain-containing protein n=1 Tax=Hyalangium rubrum TaxID=3103134 RepID=A0ABU5GYE7_9BACT|nr:TM2 domain-containing protein [Hyalangium sp. s54d21]MDY7224860.1 TM2 domain-containing protein [Hyalangium sp. s54d21]
MSAPTSQPSPTVSQTLVRPTQEPRLGQPLTASTFSGAAPYGIDPKTGLPFSHRSKIVAGVLQICLGGLGIGRFYTGHVGIAIAQIAVTFLTCGLGALWPLIDGIMILVGESPKDAEGKPLRNS